MSYDHNPSWDGQAFGVKRRVWFTGTTALRKGQGVAYDADAGTAANVDGDRGYNVQLPTDGTSALSFAGVADRAYTANALGQSIDIWIPGSFCEVAAIVDTAIQTASNNAVLNCLISAGTGLAGLFYNGGFAGLGAAMVKQTTTGNVTGSSVDGSAAVAGTTVSKTGLFTGAAAGDSVAILASATTAGAAGATAGVYTISSVTSADAAELDASAGTGDIAAVVYDPSATVLAQLLDGPAGLSGMVNWVTPLDSAAASPAHIPTVFNHIFGGITLGSADSTATLADGTFEGQTVGFKLSGALTTQDYLLTVTTGLQQDDSTALASLEFDGAADASVLVWSADKWRLKANTGAAKA